MPPIRTPESLLERRAFISAVVNDVTDAIVLADPQRRLVLLNPAVERIFGYRADELIGQPTQVLYESETEFRRVGKQYFNQQASDDPKPYVMRYRRRDGSVFPGETVAAVIRGEDGSALGFLGIIRDVSSRLDQEREIRLARQRLEEALESLDEGFSLWDADDRLVLCNRRYLELYPVAAPLTKPGVSFEALVRHGVQNGEFNVPESEREAWVRRRVARHRSPPEEPFEQRHADGHWILVAERPTREGGIAGIRVDITRRKRAELVLARLVAIGSNPELVLDRKIDALLTLGCEHFDLPIGIVSHIDGNAYTVRNVVSPDGEPAPGARFSLGETYCAHVATADGPRAWHQAGGSELRRHPCYQRFGLETYLGAPLEVGGVRYGTISFSGPHPRARAFTDADLDLLRLFAVWVGFEIDSQQIMDALHQAHEKMGRLATTDDLTGLLNRRALLSLGRKEFDRARRYGKNLCVLALDIDYFKNINDTLGHAAGDRVLEQVAGCCAAGVRTEDGVGRIGGEEFALVLIEVGHKGGQAVAERIRMAIQALDCAPGLPITASLGVAELREGDDDFEALLARADAALYWAKERGRNRVCLAPG